MLKSGRICNTVKDEVHVIFVAAEEFALSAVNVIIDFKM
jgi:hypothetical protein